MTDTHRAPSRWQVWLIGLGDLLRLPSGSVHYFDSVESAQAVAQQVGGIVQIEGAPALGGFDRALS